MTGPHDLLQGDASGFVACLAMLAGLFVILNALIMWSPRWGMGWPLYVQSLGVLFGLASMWRGWVITGSKTTQITSAASTLILLIWQAAKCIYLLTHGTNEKVGRDMTKKMAEALSKGPPPYVLGTPRPPSPSSPPARDSKRED